MNIDIVLQGKLREPYFKTAVMEFKKRLTGIIDLKIIEVSNLEEYIRNFKPCDFIITLEIEGEMLSSPEFATKIREIQNMGFYNKIIFLIGGAEGLSPNVRKRADFRFSMSKLTFLHQEACVILTEQIYRAVKILKKEPYHK